MEIFNFAESFGAQQHSIEFYFKAVRSLAEICKELILPVVFLDCLALSYYHVIDRSHKVADRRNAYFGERDGHIIN